MKIREKIRSLHLEFAESRGIEATYCPSEVARKLDPDNWMDKMNDVREVADILIQENKLEVMQKGNVLTESSTQAKGPIRLRKTR
ncbi:MAG: DUF3253 domain-containing protein [Leeuwenhoekiella sp.]